MEHLGDNCFLAGDNCFNPSTLEVFRLDDAHIKALGNLFSGKMFCAGKYEKEIAESGVFDGADSISGGQFTPTFSGFRVVLTERCNLHCRSCFVKKREHSARRMTPEDLNRIIHLTLPYGKERRLKYHFFGGEPTTAFPLIEDAVAILTEAANKGSIQPPIFTITTNGTLITDSMISFFKKHGFLVGVSIDGMRDENDALRGRGVFEKACTAFSKLQNAGVECWFLTTPYQERLLGLPAFLDELASLFNFKTITFNTPFEGATLRWSVDGALFARTLLECYHRAKVSGIVIESAASPILYALSAGTKRAFPCSISGTEVMASITPDGRGSFCAQYWGSDLFPQQFPDVSSYAFIREGKCSNCVARNICGGPCPIAVAKGTSLDPNKCLFYETFLDTFLKESGVLPCRIST